jgi:hypothetical protein
VRTAVISPYRHGDRWLWGWHLYDGRGYGTAKCVSYVDSPLEAARGLASALDGDINPTGDWIYGAGRGVRVTYDTLCPFGANRICSPEPEQEICTACTDRATVAAIMAESL